MSVSVFELGRDDNVAGIQTRIRKINSGIKDIRSKDHEFEAWIMRMIRKVKTFNLGRLVEMECKTGHSKAGGVIVVLAVFYELLFHSYVVPSVVWIYSDYIKHVGRRGDRPMR